MKIIYRYIIIFSFLFFILLGCNESRYTQRDISLKERKVFEVNSSIKSMVYFDNVIGFAGDNGMFGMIDLNHNTINTSVQKYKEIYPEYQSVVATSSDFMMLSKKNPSIIYKTEKNKMETVFLDENNDIIYNGLTFINDKVGITVGNTSNDYFFILKTTSGGFSWEKIDKKILKSKLGETIYSISNTSVTNNGADFLFVTAGTDSNLYIFSDNIEKLEKYPLPFKEGNDFQGAFSVDFYNESIGVVAGGTLQNDKEVKNNLALTFDRGKSWKVIPNKIGNINCIKYLPESDGNELILTSKNGVFFSSDKGFTWKKLSDEVFNIVECINNKNVAFSSDKKIKIVELIEKR